jgi:glycosyltransferase involved in cell wall biosynthesis
MGIRHPHTGGAGALRSLVLATKLPHPPRAGGDLRTLQTVDALARLGPVGVVAVGGGDGRAAPEEPPVAVWRGLPDPPPDLPLAWLRDPLGHPGDRWFSPDRLDEVARAVDELGAKVAVLEMLWLHRYAGPLREMGCKVVLNAHNLEGPLHEEMAAQRGDPLSAKLAEHAVAIEAAAFGAVDQVWVCSEREAEHVDAPAAVVPNTLDVSRYEELERAEEPATLLYPGIYAYPPNQTAARRLLAIFPRFADLAPDARLVLLGAGATADMGEAAAADPRIEVTGEVEDTRPFLARATVMPVPLVEGGGTRFKVLEALSAGVPVVSTAKGVEGLDLVPGEHYAAAETDDELLDALASLCSDAGARRELAARGRELVRERYSWSASRAATARALGELGVV